MKAEQKSKYPPYDTTELRKHYEVFTKRVQPNITVEIMERECGLNKATISHLLNGYSELGQPKARDNLVKIIWALVKLKAISSLDEANAFLQAAPLKFEMLRRSYPEDRKVLDLFVEMYLTHIGTETFDQPIYQTADFRSLVGRNKDIAAICAKLQEDIPRLLVITGLPGVGKTELAWQVALQAQKYGLFDQAFFISLASLSNLSAVISQIAEQLKITKEITNGAAEETLNAIVKHVGDKHVLIILDNCEQFIDEDGEFRKLLLSLLQKCKNLKIAATSRILFSQDEYKVLPLSLPNQDEYTRLDTETLRTYAAIELFIQRAREADKNFSLDTDPMLAIASICLAIDGLPLAINIVTSYIKVLGVVQIHDMLVSKDYLNLQQPFADSVHHLSLEKLLAWSYDMLGEKEQKLFRRLSIFAGGCNTETAIKVCNVGDLPNNIAEAVNLATKLNWHNLIVFVNQRIFMIHNTIQDYALFKLREVHEEEKIIRRRHRDFFAEKAKILFLNLFPDLSLCDPWFSQEDVRKDIEQFTSELETFSDIIRVKSIFLSFEEHVNYWLKDTEPVTRKMIENGTYLPIIKNLAMETALAEHKNFYEALKWTLQEAGAVEWIICGYLMNIWHLPDHYANLCLQWMGLWVLEFGSYG